MAKIPATAGTMTIGVNIKLTIWTAIKMRIAGIRGLIDMETVTMKEQAAILRDMIDRREIEHLGQR